ncbi:hypothetical protein ABPG74_003269 [Tetrahymena malaccensis]
MRVEIWRLNLFACFIFQIFIKEKYCANPACASASNQASCQNPSGCNGVWDNTNLICYDCSLSSNCQPNCLRRWINNNCVMKCTNAQNQSDCNTCYGYWNSSTNQCYDCMQDQSTCTDLCNRFWINGFCWDCNGSSAICTNNQQCNGTWNGSACSVCWPNQSYCNACNNFWDTSVATPVCINCQQDQATCETAAKCNGYWDSVHNFCTVCSLSQANCQGSICNGTWNQLLNTCSNCNNDQRQCQLCNKNYLYGQCVDCNSGYNTCTSITYCNGQWDATNSVCTICNQSQAICQTTGTGNCSGTWQTSPSPARCNKCQNNQTECTKCGMNWIPSVPGVAGSPGVIKCFNCNQDSATCQNTAGCNGIWNSSTNTCLICNLDAGTCSSCPQLRNWNPSDLVNGPCLSCFQSQGICTSCNYFWVPSNPNYDPSIQNMCINCNSSQDYCVNKQKCNGHWDQQNSVCDQQCNLSSTNCVSVCSGSWDNTNKLCNVCSKTQAECNLCNKQWVLGQCINCKQDQPTCQSAACSGIWSGSTCLVCNENSTNCKQCGGFWIDSQCLKCDSSSTVCTQCGGIYNTITNNCVLLNDQYTCLSLMQGTLSTQGLSQFLEPFWNGVLCVDCQASQYICNKECFRVWTNNACSNQSCSTDQYTCESICFLHWNYYQNTCYFDDINQNSICTISNDSMMVNGNCIQCHASQDLCENQCNQAYSLSATRAWVNNKCTDCQQDQNTCTNVCKMNWITITVGAQTKNVCIYCSSDMYNCAMCQGQWNQVSSTCQNIGSFCNQSSTNCSNCSFIPTLQFKYSSTSSQCYYCNLNQFTCQTACQSLWLPNLQYCEVLTTQDYCQLNNRGYWDTTTSTCTLCNSSQAACTKCSQYNIWNSTLNVCQNINLGQQYCPTSATGGNFVWVTDQLSSTYGISLQNGRCVSCNLSSTVCQNACQRSWSVSPAPGTCLTCNSSQAVCEGNCLMNWVPQSPQKCALCNANQNTCVNICNWYWNSLTNSCINCNKDQVTCQNPSTCNGSWNSGTNLCQFCNLSQAICEKSCFFIYSQQNNSCINCQSSQQVCQQQCGYIWNPTLPANTNCILCNQSQAICQATGQYQCNGFWLASNKCTQIKCNQDQNTCVNKCIMVWNSIQNICQACSQTQYQQTTAVDPFYTCLPCNQLTLASDCSNNCKLNQFFWDTTITSATKCRQCTALEYWNGTQCILCTSIDPNCNWCQQVSGTATCLGCSNNYRVKTTTSCSCDGDRIPNSSGVCTLCSSLITNCSLCSSLTACGTCAQGYSWDTTNKVCRAKFTFTSNTLSGIAFLTDFTFTLSYPNANNPTNAPIVYAVYLYDSINAYNNELSNFLNQQISVGVLYQKGLAQNTGYSVKLKTGNPVLAPLLILNGQVIPPEDQILIFTVTQQFTYLDQFTKYINDISSILTPQDFYYKQFSDELVNQYYQNACSNCPSGVTCIANTQQCNCALQGANMTLYDCSGLDNSQFNQLATNLFSYFKSTNTSAQSQQKLNQLLIQVGTTGNSNMNPDLFEFYASLLPNYVSGKTTPTPSDYMNFIDIIKKVVTYTDYMVANNLATSASQIYYPHDMIQYAIIAVLDYQTTYTLETLQNNRLSAAAVSALTDLVTTVDVYQLQYGSTKPPIYSQSSSLTKGGAVKAARFFYNSDPYFIGNSTFTSYTNYPFIEYFVYQKSGSAYKRQDVNFTFTFTVAEIKSSTKCVMRQGDYLVLCGSQQSDTTNLKITCVCTNSATLIEKTILVEPIVTVSSSNNYILYIILGCSLGGSLVIFLAFLFVYLKKQALNDKFKILKKQKDGSRAIDPNLSLSDYDLEIKE